MGVLPHQGIHIYVSNRKSQVLLPSGSEQHEVLLFGSIQEVILQDRHKIVQIEKKTEILI